MFSVLTLLLEITNSIKARWLQAQSAANLNSFNELIHIGKLQVQQLLTSGCFVQYLDQEIVLYTLKESHGLPAASCIAFPGDVWMAGVPCS